MLSENDLRNNTRFDDAVATGCWYMDVHPHQATPGSAQSTKGFQPDPYDIPYRALLPKKVSNLLVAGRCHSADKMAASSTRVTVTAMAMGQAAGIAAALAVQRKTSAGELPVPSMMEATCARSWDAGRVLDMPILYMTAPTCQGTNSFCP